MTTKLMHVTTPQILWHGGGVTDGKADPVYSVDFHPKENVLLTTGIDASVPPRGSIRLWKIEADREEERFLVDFSEHGSVVNVARFSPCGTMIASASDKQVIVYRLLEPFTWAEVEELKQVERKRFTPSLNDIVDLAWSPDSSYIIIGALEQKPEILRIASKEKQRENSVLLPSHGNYVQGVTWDPYNQFVATQSADRSVKVHKMSYRENTMVKLAPNGHVTIKMYANPNEKEESSGFDWQSANTPEAETANTTSEPGSASKKKRGGVGINLFADSNVPSSFRRLSFSPDGSLLIVPTGVFRPQALPNTTANTSSSSSATTNNKNESKNTSFCTHIFARSHLQHPVMSLLGLEDPSVAVRCCPVLFQPLPHNTSPSSPSSLSSQQSMLIKGDYRMVFAVVTVTSVYLYDTQHCFPLAKFRGLHYAPINDVAWSGDGLVLVLCSSDGYLSFVRFKAGALGEPLPTDKVPDVVKLARPGAYDVSHLKTFAPPPQTTSITTSTTSQEKVDEVTSPAAEPLTAVTTSTETATSNTTKKRKRIQPEVIKAETEVVMSQESQSPKKAKTQPFQPSNEINAENSVSNSLTEMTSEAQ